MIDRRRALLIAAAAAVPASVRAASTAGSAANQWFAVRGDEGQPVPNTRAPTELVEDVEDLPGAIWAGPKGAAVQLVEFYDYNCPWCRAADDARDALQRTRGDLRVGLVGNPILSPASAQATKVDLAVLKRHGAAASYALHKRLFALKGRIDGPRALETAAELGHDRAEIERIADSDEIGTMLRRQMSLAASLGISATPSYVVGGAVVLGYPGPKSLARMVADAATCGTIAC
ncbi:DsbA family protein [Enterovirga rhinocerotis]|uniref:Protein-disulfide isomerase n=1 Tax=Enterovirga rhinocerotis TaxID=1339210 RepID=A0A4R7C7L3_9HYPH|nr:DsbA family protein [Enterovirga rhinocerotis]TDR94630.1 protein-disulfide isomerase [Enterovirga rhinocerotis]